jgi:glycerophosphoryl diester phosphodiesterase
MRLTFKHLILIVTLAALVGIIVGLRGWSARPAADHPYLDNHRFWVLAHRGGRSLGPENTLYTFRRAADIGVDVIELDTRLTRDRHIVVLHDSTVNRTTDGSGRVQDLTLEQLKQLDAAYRWSPDGDARFPLRGKGIAVPTLQEVFAALPYHRINIEMKSGNGYPVKDLCRLIKAADREKRVMVASFKDDLLKDFRVACPGVATSAGGGETRAFFGLNTIGLSRIYRPDAQAFQVPERYGKVNVINRSFIAAAHERNMKVHVWTVNDTASMQRLIQLQVDGIVTDYPDRLLGLLQRGQPD